MSFARPLTQKDRASYNQVVNHPLQSWEWGDFKAQTNHIVERVGIFEGQKMIGGFQVIFNSLPAPFSSTRIGYVPKGRMPDEAQINALKSLAEKHQAAFIKLEPDVAQPVDTSTSAAADIISFLEKNGATKGKPLFTKYDFWLNIRPTEEELFASFHSKTRYNIRLAIKKGVQIVENTSPEGMEVYIKLMEETTKRQGFYNHTGDYFRQLLKYFSDGNQIHIFHALYEGQPLTAWIVFNFNGKLYYPYGASSNDHREVMPNNLMLWEVIRFGKSQGCQLFDLWGSLGPDPDKNDPWYGFHRFKAGYNPVLMEYIGTFDLVYNPRLYKMIYTADKWRWRFLRLKSRLFK